MAQLPAASRVGCAQRMVPDGACCFAEFGDLYSSEIHIYRQKDGTYLIKATVPACKNPEHDPSADPGSPGQLEFVPCPQRWGVEAHPVVNQ